MKNKLWLLVLLLALAGCNLNADEEDVTPEAIPTQAELPPPATFQVTNTPPPIQLTDRPSVGVTIVPDIRASITPEPTSNAQPFPVYDSTSTAQPTVTAELPSTYKDRYETQVTANVTLIVDYNVTLNRTGQYVTLWVRDPNGTILGSKTVTQTEAASLEVQTQVSGTHEILVYFDRLDGGYQVSFRTR